MNNFIDVSWSALKSNMEAKKLSPRLQWTLDKDIYHLYFFDGPMNLHAEIRITNPKNSDQHDFETNFKATTNKVLEPLDSENSLLSRPKITQAGWAYQNHTIGMQLGKLVDGIHNKKINPSTLVIEDLKSATNVPFATMKLYKEDRTLIAEGGNEAEAKYTVIDWCVDHEMEIIGAIFTQNQVPVNDVWLWVFGAPGIANVAFCQGGINIKRLGTGNQVNADGRAAKYMHPLKPIPGVNKFRMIFYHPIYEAHPCQMLFQLFKP